jgi:FkbM family methyltransferase
MSNALQLLERLEASCANTSIDWESVLARQYTAVLHAPRTVVDVGANEGLHTRQLVALGTRQVVCIEPMPHLAAGLAAEFGPSVRVVNAALSWAEGRQTFQINLDVPTHSGLRSRTDTPASARVEDIVVDTTTLDALGLTDVDFIKLDCEGGDLDVLRGGEATIAASRPLVSIEYGSAGYLAYGHHQFSLFEWAAAHDYVVADLFGNPLAPRDVYAACVDRYYWDYFLVPAESTLLPVLQASAVTLFGDMAPFKTVLQAPWSPR